MAECGSLPGCPFFNDRMANMPVTANSMKKRYCLGDNTKCARYMVSRALGKERVPSGLGPGQVDKAEEIIAAG